LNNKIQHHVHEKTYISCTFTKVFEESMSLDLLFGCFALGGHTVCLSLPFTVTCDAPCLPFYCIYQIYKI